MGNSIKVEIYDLDTDEAAALGTASGLTLHAGLYAVELASGDAAEGVTITSVVLDDDGETYRSTALSTDDITGVGHQAITPGNL